MDESAERTVAVRKEKNLILTEIVSKLQKVYQPSKIYLLGSRARGDAREDSDYDVMVIVDDTAPKELKSPTKAYEALWDADANVDVLIWTKEAFDKRLHIANSLPAEIERSGQTLYVA